MASSCSAPTCSDILVPKVKKQVDAAPKFREKLNEHMTACGHNDEGYINWAEADKARADLKAAGFPADVLGPETASLAAGGAIFEKLWATYADPKSLFPDLTPYATISQYQALRRWEYQACKATALKVAKRYIAAGGASAASAKRRRAIKPTALVGGVKTDNKPLASGLALRHGRDLLGVAGGGRGAYEARPRRRLGRPRARAQRARGRRRVATRKPSTRWSSSATTATRSSSSIPTSPARTASAAASTSSTSTAPPTVSARRRPRPTSPSTTAGGDYKTGKVHGWQARGVHRYQVTSIETV